MKINSIWLLSALIFGVTLFASCLNNSASPAINEEDLRAIENDICSGPVRAETLVDETTSMAQTGTRKVVAEELLPLIDRLTECGGDLSIRYIRENLGSGSERLRFPEPLLPPERPQKLAAEESYEFSDRVDAYNLKLIERKAQIDRNKADLKQKIDEFMASLRLNLARRPANSTDFNSALNAADIVLSETDDIWRVKPRKFLILVSDAIDTQKRPKFKFRSGARVLWVNTSTDERRLAGLDVTRVEDFTAAVREIVEGGRR